MKLAPAGSGAVFGPARAPASPVSNGHFFPSGRVCGVIGTSICPCARPASLWGVTGTHSARHFLLLPSLLLLFLPQRLRF